jgi:hypothetical protein
LAFGSADHAVALKDTIATTNIMLARTRFIFRSCNVSPLVP